MTMNRLIFIGISFSIIGITLGALWCQFIIKITINFERIPQSSNQAEIPDFGGLLMTSMQNHINPEEFHQECIVKRIGKTLVKFCLVILQITLSKQIATYC